MPLWSLRICLIRLEVPYQFWRTYDICLHGKWLERKDGERNVEWNHSVGYIEVLSLCQLLEFLFRVSGTYWNDGPFRVITLLKDTWILCQQHLFFMLFLFAIILFPQSNLRLNFFPHVIPAFKFTLWYHSGKEGELTQEDDYLLSNPYHLVMLLNSSTIFKWFSIDCYFGWLFVLSLLRSWSYCLPVVDESYPTIIF